MSVKGFYDFLQGEMKYVLFIILFFLIAYTVYKRAWVALVGSILGLALVGIFIVDPEILLSLGGWMKDIFNIGE